jgi:hypothetical protein
VDLGKASGPATVSVSAPRATDLLPSNRREANPTIEENQLPTIAPTAAEACANLQFEFLVESFEHSVSLSISAREAAFRGSLAELRMRFQQLRLVLKEASGVFRELESGGQGRRAT